MTEYTYTVDSTNYNQNVTFKLGINDILYINSTEEKTYSYGISGRTGGNPSYSIDNYNEITGIYITRFSKITKNNYIYNIKIIGNEINKNFQISLFMIYNLFLTRTKGGVINIEIINNVSNIKIKVNNNYIDGTPKIKISGNWTDGSAYVKVDGSWRK